MHWWKDEFCRLFLIVCCYFFSWGERVEHLGSLGYDGSKCIWMFVVGISLIVFLFKMCFWLLKPTSNIPEFHSSTSGYDHWNGSSLGWYFTMYLGQLSEPRCTEIAFVIIMKEEACTPNCPKTHEPHRDVVLGGQDLIFILCVASCCPNFKLTWGLRSSFWRNPNAHSHEILHTLFRSARYQRLHGRNVLTCIVQDAMMRNMSSYPQSTHLQGVPDHIIVIDRPAKILMHGFLAAWIWRRILMLYKIPNYWKHQVSR